MSAVQLRPYQVEIQNNVFGAWNAGYRNVMMVMATGMGKSATLSDTVAKWCERNPGKHVVVIAHRQELVSQLSLTLAKWGLRHMTVCAEKVRRDIRKQHLTLFKADFLAPESFVVVASVDTLIKRDLPWFDNVGLWVVDEAHHVTRDNKWGTVISFFPNAVGLGPTASPRRGDKKGLGSGPNNDGVMDIMVEGPPMGWAIANGYLTDYKVLSIPSDIDYSQVAIGSDGDYNQAQLRKAVRKSNQIVGDVVTHYCQHALGMLGIAFTVDVEEAEKLADAFNALGITAKALSANTPADERSRAMQDFRDRKIMVLTNCDILGEGVDVPAVEVVMMVRKTQSLSLYLQQFGRALRPAKGKGKALILDHVGNVIDHKYPDVPRVWSLERPETQGKKKDRDEDIESLQYCMHCTATFEKWHTHCPGCGKEVMPPERRSIKQVAGDLVLLDPDLFGDLQREVAQQAIYMPPRSAGPAAVGAYKKNFDERRAEQGELVNIMQWYGGWRNALGMTMREAQRAFYLEFGIDIMNAQCLNRKDSEELRLRIEQKLTAAGVKFNLEEAA